jgi:hypothetical protein
MCAASAVARCAGGHAVAISVAPGPMLAGVRMGGCTIRRAAAIVLLAASAWAADVRVLATTGVRIDGFGLAGIEQPVGVHGDVVFRGFRTSIEVAGRTMASGDPLPAPLTGTFEQIVQGATAGNLGAVTTAANGPDVAWAIFLVEGANVTPLVSVGGSDGVSLRALTMNAKGDVAYSAIASSRGPVIAVRPRVTGVSTVVTEPSRNLRRLWGFTMDETGAVAWMDNRGSVFHWDATHGLRVVDSSGRRPSGSAKRAVALHPSFGLAYATHDVVRRWDPATGVTTTVLERRARVSGRRITRIYGDVGFLDDGTVSVRAGRRICVGGAPVVCDTPGKAGAGEAVAPRHEAGVFRLRRGSTEAVVRPGDVLPGDGQLDDVIDHVAVGSTVVFAGMLSDQRVVLGRSRKGHLDTLAVDGQQVRGLTLSLGTTIFDARGAFVAVAASLLDPDGNAPTRPLDIALIRNTGDVRPLFAPHGERFANAVVQDAVLAGNRAVVLTSVPDALISGRRRTKPVLVERNGLRFDPDSGPGVLAGTGSRVVFTAENAHDVWGLYELDGRSPRRIAELPDWPTLFVADGDDVAFAVAPTEDGGLTYTPQLWIVRDGIARELVRSGDPTPLGAITSIDAVGLTSDDVVFVATLAGDGARHALLAVPRR